MSVFNIFKKKDACGFPDGTLYFHEDTESMISLLPIENLIWLKRQLKTASEISEESFLGFGWTSVYAFKDADISLASRNIKRKDLELIIQKTGLSKAPAVVEFYSQTMIRRPNTHAFGEDNGGIFYNTKSSFVQDIWFADLTAFDRNKMTEFLHESGQKWKLLLVDWFIDKIVNLSDKESIRNYLDSYDD